MFMRTTLSNTCNQYLSAQQNSILNLPARHDETIKIAMSGAQSRLYNAIRNEELLQLENLDNASQG